MDDFLLRVGLLGMIVLIFFRLISVSQSQPEERNLFMVGALGMMLFGFVIRLFEPADTTHGKLIATWALVVYFTLETEVKKHLPGPLVKLEQDFNYWVINKLRKIGAFGWRNRK